ncbi:MAG: P27 family phage terminase small subunit [Vicinamibacterales bacterium]
MAGNANSGGHNKKPSHLHVLAGTFRSDRHGDAESPDPPQATPKPPKKLTGEAKAEWDRMVARLVTSKTVTTVDDAALYQYVQLFAETEQINKDHAETRRMRDELKKLAASKLNGADLVDAIGHIVKLQQALAKQSQQLRQGHMALRQYLVEFGMTPSARGRVKMTNKKPADPKSGTSNKQRFFGGARA